MNIREIEKEIREKTEPQRRLTNLWIDMVNRTLYKIWVTDFDKNKYPHEK